jgi:DNA anti-recombination protein RmuC
MTALSTLGGAAWGGFQIYTDYMNMKAIIENIDTDAISARNNLIETKLNDAIDYTRDIKDGLRDDLIQLELTIDRFEDKLDQTERRTKNTQDSIESSLESVRDEMNNTQKDITTAIRQVEALNRETEKDVRDTMRDTESRIEEDMRRLDDDIHERLQEALNNPLSN